MGEKKKRCNLVHNIESGDSVGGGVMGAAAVEGLVHFWIVQSDCLTHW